MKIDKTRQVISTEQLKQDFTAGPMKQKEKESSGTAEARETVSLSSSATRDLKKPGKASKPASHGTSRSEKPEKKKWTVMVYFAGDNDLEPYLAKNLVDLEKVGSTKDMHMIAQIDRGKTPTATYGGEAGASRYEIVKDKHSNGKIDSKEVSHMGKLNSSDPEVLKDFLKWGMKKYPAENYLIILNDHGAGFAGVLQDVEAKGFMQIPGIKEAFKDAEKETGVSPKNIILGFDACLMGQAEVAYELRNVANIMVASEEAIGGTGWPYEGILSGNKFDKINQNYSGEEALNKMAGHIIDETAKTQNATFTMSAVDLTKMNDVKDAVDGLGNALLKTKEPQSRIRRIIQMSQHYTAGYEERPYSEMRDIYDIASRIEKSRVVNDEKLKVAAREVMKVVEGAVIKEQHKKEDVGDSHGLSIYAPIQKGGYDSFDYGRLELAKNTSWDEAMIRFTGDPTKPSSGSGWTYSPPKGKGPAEKLK
ncbi:MAG: clostripain-related cysteine peptidase [Chloroflexi bacterium]|nr:clostripain-related cysteine peptidase [Chloroflexota bacterium]